MVLYDVSLFPPAILQEIDRKYGPKPGWKMRWRLGGTGSPPLQWLPDLPEAAPNHPLHQIVGQHGTGFRDKRQLLLNAEIRTKGWLLHANLANRKFFVLAMLPGAFKEIHWGNAGKLSEGIPFQMQFEVPDFNLWLKCAVSHRNRLESFVQKIKGLEK